MTRTRRVTDGERGSILITGLLLSLAVLMVLGAVVDLGHAFIERRELVTIADDAALVGSQAIDESVVHDGRILLNAGSARQQAVATIDRGGRTTATASADVDRVTVTVTRRVQTVLLGLVGMRTLIVSASSTAEPRRP
jgi:Flp pilus assembly protein TadG